MEEQGDGHPHPWVPTLRWAPIMSGFKNQQALTPGEPESQETKSLLSIKGPTCYITHHVFQHRRTSSISAWVIHDEDLLTDFLTCVRGARICRSFLQEHKCRWAPFFLFYFSLDGYMLAKASSETLYLLAALAPFHHSTDPSYIIHPPQSPPKGLLSCHNWAGGPCQNQCSPKANLVPGTGKLTPHTSMPIVAITKPLSSLFQGQILPTTVPTAVTATTGGCAQPTQRTFPGAPDSGYQEGIVPQGTFNIRPLLSRSGDVGPT